eukprot:2164084-Alexandrium_andersonii.AAC.1
MSASLVGSEMCIRDSFTPRPLAASRGSSLGFLRASAAVEWRALHYSAGAPGARDMLIRARP